MDRRMDGLAGAMREIAKQRDNQLRAGEEIPEDRLQQLRAFLSAELPVESALFAAARRRDGSGAVLSAVRHAALVEQVRLVGANPRPLAALRQMIAWLKAPVLPGIYRTAAAIGVVVIVGLVPIYLSRSINSGARTSHVLRSIGIAHPDLVAFSNDAAHLTLRPTGAEVAFLNSSFVRIDRALPNLEHADRVLPLDLPVRQIRLDVEAVRTP